MTNSLYPGGKMRELTMYCSARDQEVRVVLTDTAVNGTQASIMDSDLVCLEVGDACTGSMCPICATSPHVVDARVVKLGLRPEVHKKVRALCDGCDRETELVMSSGGYVTCTECGTTREWQVVPTPGA
jgi:hypothetical protein